MKEYSAAHNAPRNAYHGNRSELLIYAAVALVVFIYICLRAALVPIVHDEAATFYHYIITGNFWPGKAHWDANNHVLNSLLAWCSVQVFGEGLFSLRLFNVLSFPVWAIATWWITRSCGSALVRWCFVLALLLCPFVLDFFSLTRGYGIGMAFFLLAFTAAINFIKDPKERELHLLLWSGAIAIWSDLGLVPVLGISSAIVVLLTHRTAPFRLLFKWRVMFSLICCGLLWIAALWFAMELRSRGLLYHGTLDGFYAVTLKSLFKFTLGSNAIMGIMLTLTIGVSVMFAAIKRPNVEVAKTPAGYAALVLFTLFAATMVMGHLLHVNFPEDRAALQFLVLFIIAFGLSVNALADASSPLKWFALCLLVFPVRTIYSANFERTLLWPEQSLPVALIDAAERAQRDNNGPMTIGLYHQHGLVWVYASRQRNDGLAIPRVDPFPDTLSDMLLADARFTGKVQYPYVMKQRADHDGLTFYTRTQPLQYTMVFHQKISPFMRVDEFIDLPKPTNDSNAVHARRVTLKATLRIPHGATFYWVMGADDGHGGDQYLSSTVHYTQEDKEGLRQVELVQILLPSASINDRLACYFWDPGRAEVELISGSITYDRID